MKRFANEIEDESGVAEKRIRVGPRDLSLLLEEFIIIPPEQLKHLRWKRALIAKDGEDASYLDLLPGEVLEPIMEMYEDNKARELHRERWKPIMEALLSFGSFCCTKNSGCADHHPRNVLVNWRYKVDIDYLKYRFCKFVRDCNIVFVRLPVVGKTIDFFAGDGFVTFLLNLPGVDFLGDCLYALEDFCKRVQRQANDYFF